MPPITPATLANAVTKICTKVQPVAMGADVVAWCARHNIDIDSGGSRKNDLFEAADHTQTTASALQKFKRGRSRNGLVAWCLLKDVPTARAWLKKQPQQWFLVPWDPSRGRWNWPGSTPV